MVQLLSIWWLQIKFVQNSVGQAQSRIYFRRMVGSGYFVEFALTTRYLIFWISAPSQKYEQSVTAIRYLLLPLPILASR